MVDFKTPAVITELTFSVAAIINFKINTNLLLRLKEVYKNCANLESKVINLYWNRKIHL